MKIFKDEDGREWKLIASIGAFKRIRDLTGTDLTHLLDDRQQLRSITEDVAQFVDVLAAWLLPQLDEQGVSQEAFAEMLAGGVWDDAFEAFVEEVPNFTPPTRREAVRAVLGTVLSSEKKAAARVTAAMANPAIGEKLESLLDREMAKAEEEIDRAIRSDGGDGSTASRES